VLGAFKFCGACGVGTATDRQAETDAVLAPVLAPVAVGVVAAVELALGVLEPHPLATRLTSPRARIDGRRFTGE
jgi:hypothetical protein